MRRLFLPIILFLFVIIEGVSLELLPVVYTKTLIIPHWVLLFLVCVTLFYDLEDTYTAIYYGIVFGLLIDIVYTGVLGVYMFSYAAVLYIIHKLKVVIHTNFYTTMILGLLAIILADSVIYIIFLAVELTHMVWNDYLIYRLLPSLLANLIFLILLYPLSKRLLTRWKKSLFSKNEIV